MDKRAKGLCFTSDDKWFYNHIRKNRRELSVMLIRNDEEGELEKDKGIAKEDGDENTMA